MSIQKKKPLNKGSCKKNLKPFSDEKESRPDDHNDKEYCGTVRYFGDFHAFDLFDRKGVSRSYNLNQRTDLVTYLQESKRQSCLSLSIK